MCNIEYGVTDEEIELFGSKSVSEHCYKDTIYAYWK